MLLLGHPVYSVSAVLFSLLLTSGLGSYSSGRITPGGERHKMVLLMVGILALFYSFISPLILPLLGLPIAARLLATSILIAPLGFLMGMPFPLGVRLLTGSRRPLIPWAWAVNGCASVLGSILPTILALNIGFSRIYQIAGAIYLVSLLMVVIRGSKKSNAGKDL